MNLNVLDLLMEENVGSKKHQFNNDLHEMRAKNWSAIDICKKLAEKYSYSFEDVRTVIVKGMDVEQYLSKSAEALARIPQKEFKDLARKYKRYGVEYSANHAIFFKKLVDAIIEGNHKYGKA
jgi:hypothetical protein